MSCSEEVKGYDRGVWGEWGGPDKTPAGPVRQKEGRRVTYRLTRASRDKLGGGGYRGVSRMGGQEFPKKKGKTGRPSPPSLLEV